MSRTKAKDWLWVVVLACLSLLGVQPAAAQALDVATFMRETPRTLIERMIARHGIETIATFISTAYVLRWAGPVRLCYERGLFRSSPDSFEASITGTAAFIGKLVNQEFIVVPNDLVDATGWYAPTGPCDIVVVPVSDSPVLSSESMGYFRADRRRAIEEGLRQAFTSLHPSLPGHAEYFLDGRGNARRMFSFIRFSYLKADPNSGLETHLAFAVSRYGGYIRGRSDEPLTPADVPLLENARNILSVLVIAARSGVMASDPPDERIRKVTAFLRSGAFDN